MPPLGLQLALLRVLRPALLAGQQHTLGHTSMMAVVVLDVRKVAAGAVYDIGAVLAGGYFFMVPKGNITEATVCALSPSATTKRIYKLSLQSLQSRRHTFPSNSLLVSQLSTWVSPSRR